MSFKIRWWTQATPLHITDLQKGHIQHCFRNLYWTSQTKRIRHYNCYMVKAAKNLVILYLPFVSCSGRIWTANLQNTTQLRSLPQIFKHLLWIIILYLEWSHFTKSPSIYETFALYCFLMWLYSFLTAKVPTTSPGSPPVEDLQTLPAGGWQTNTKSSLKTCLFYVFIVCEFCHSTSPKARQLKPSWQRLGRHLPLLHRQSFGCV